MSARLRAASSNVSFSRLATMPAASQLPPRDSVAPDGENAFMPSRCASIRARRTSKDLLLEAQLTHALVGQKEIGNGCRPNQLGQSEPAGSSHDTFYGAPVAKGIGTRYSHIAEYI